MLRMRSKGMNDERRDATHAPTNDATRTTHRQTNDDERRHPNDPPPDERHGRNDETVTATAAIGQCVRSLPATAAITITTTGRCARSQCTEETPYHRRHRRRRHRCRRTFLTHMVYGLSDPKVCERYHCATTLGSRRRAPLTCS